MKTIINIIGDSISEGAGSIQTTEPLPKGLSIKGPAYGWVRYLGLLLLNISNDVVIINNAIGAQGPRYFWYCSPANITYNLTIIESVRQNEDKYYNKLLKKYENSVSLQLIPDEVYETFRRIKANYIYKKYLSSDGVHPTDEGHVKLAHKVFSYIINNNFGIVTSPTGNTQCIDAKNINVYNNIGFTYRNIVNKHYLNKSFFKSIQQNDFMKLKFNNALKSLYIVCYSHASMSSLEITYNNYSTIIDTNINFTWLSGNRGLPVQFLLGENLDNGTIITIRNRCTNNCEAQITGLMLEYTSPPTK